MSVKVMGQVWELDIPSSEKLVLLAYADHADHDGTGIYPAVPLVARKTGYSEREVQRLTRRLEDRGLLIADGRGPRGANRWRCATSAGGDKMSPVTLKAAGGDNMSPVTSEGVTAMSPVTSEGVTSATGRGDIGRGEGVTPVSPKPSLTVKEPSTRAALSQVRKGQAEAQVRDMLANASKAAYENREKIPEPYLAYADTYHELTGQEPTRRVLHDWLATFSDWVAEGIQPQHVRTAHQESQGRFVVLRPGSLTNMAAACRARQRLGSRKRRDEAEESRLWRRQVEEAKARAVPMPAEVRRRLDEFMQRHTVPQEAA